METRAQPSACQIQLIVDRLEMALKKNLSGRDNKSLMHDALQEYTPAWQQCGTLPGGVQDCLLPECGIFESEHNRSSTVELLLLTVKYCPKFQHLEAAFTVKAAGVGNWLTCENWVTQSFICKVALETSLIWDLDSCWPIADASHGVRASNMRQEKLLVLENMLYFAWTGFWQR